MVSKYLASPPSGKYGRLHGEMETLANDMAELMRDGVGEEGVLFYFCEHFFDWKKRGLLCNLCNKGSLVVMEKEREKNRILQDLADACDFISKNAAFSRLMPQVRMNIARAKKFPLSKKDVASIPGRLVSVDRRVFAVAPPEFGASSHLAEVLLNVVQHTHALTSVMNVRLEADVIKVARSARLPLTDSLKNVSVLLADRGGFGKEPCLYIFAPTAMEVARIAATLAIRLRE
jgi:predicted fused transcriptional regulator/phosphomethylpyrimidine kinase